MHFAKDMEVFMETIAKRIETLFTEYALASPQHPQIHALTY